MTPDLAYRSGLITTQNLFTQRHGYFEMRAKLPAGRGLWPAFWLLPAGGGWPPEIDVMEVLGHEPDTLHTSVHWTQGGHKSTIQRIRVTDMSLGSIVLPSAGSQRSSAGSSMGRRSHERRRPRSSPSRCICWQTSPWTARGAGLARRTSFPATMQIDWIRAYRF